MTNIPGNMRIIFDRYSCRSFSDKKISDEQLNIILEAGRWAPSGLNNQPWKWIVVRDSAEIRQKLASYTTSGHIINGAAINIVVLYDRSTGYNYVKDVQGIGASIENMLLAASALSIGSCWLGQILNNADKVLELFKSDLISEKDPAGDGGNQGVKPRYELMAVISLGYPADPDEINKKKRNRKDISDILIKVL